jgi:hypothetical protein
MKKLVVTALALIASVPASAQVRPSLLIIGLPHFSNPGHDIANTRVADVTTAKRQVEIEAIVQRLAAFRPTRVAVEWPASAQARLDQRYADYRAGRYKLSANETDQIGLRLAARLGLPRVDAVDWNEMPPGKESDYDFVAWADAHGQGEIWKSRVQHQQAKADAEARLMACTPVSSWLRRLNRPAERREMQRPYYEIAGMGDNGANPGAAWVGSWYARNLRILNNLSALAVRSQDRVLAIYGAGHGYLLDQQAREAGKFDVAEPLSFLPASSRDSWTRCPK